MDAARARNRGRRLRRGTVQRPLNARLVRVGFVVVLPALLAFLFSLSPTGALPREPLDPLFDAASASTFAETLTAQFPSRVPGSDGALDAAIWYRETVAGLGLPTEEDVWVEDLADLGRVELRNIVTIVAGRSQESIVLVAHRDNAGTELQAGENVGGTAALIELARGYAPQEIGPDPLPQHTLVLVSTDGGAYGGAGAARFATTSPLAREAIAAIVLEASGQGRPRLAIGGDSPVSPARALVRTAAARLAEETGAEPELPSVAAQLVALGIPFALEEQGRFLATGLSTVTLGMDDTTTGAPLAAEERLGQLGRATETLVTSLDESVGGAYRTPDSIFVGERAASGWTLRLVLVLSVVPFALGLVDLLVRGRRRRIPFAPALRAQRVRLGYAAFAGVTIWLAALVGILPTGAPLPLPPYASLVTSPSLLGLSACVVVLAAGWLIARERVVPHRPPTPDERLAGLSVGLGLAGLVAVTLAFAQPYALVFVLPALYAWLWLPLEAAGPTRVGLYSVGFLTPALAGWILARELGLSLVDVTLYVLGLFTVGYMGPLSAVLALAWIAAAAQVGALAFGRYGAYAAGMEPPPAGVLRRLAERVR